MKRKRRTLKTLLKTLPIMALSACPLAAQSTVQLPSNPKEAIQRERVGALLSFVDSYWQYETEGGRLTDDGWRAAGVFFAHPVPPPRKRTIFIIGYYGVGGETMPVIKRIEMPSADVQAISQVKVSTNYPIGKLDSALRFSPSTAIGFDVTYDLVLTNKHPAWKFRDEGFAIFIGLPTAILYVRLMRDSTTDLTLRKNADATLAVLTKIKPY